MSITKELVQELFHYDPIKGKLIWLKGRNAGKEAGHLCNKYKLVTIHGNNVSYSKIIHLYMTGKMPSNQCRYINGDTFDNTWKNLDFTGKKTIHKKRSKKNICISEIPKGYLVVVKRKGFKPINKVCTTIEEARKVRDAYIKDCAKQRKKSIEERMKMVVEINNKMMNKTLWQKIKSFFIRWG